MDKNSTQLSQATSATKGNKAMGPKKSTIMFIRQFARVYMPIANMPGIALN